LSPGVYNASSSLGVTGTLTLDAGGDPDAVFIFQIGSTLTTASSSVVSLIGGAQACNVFWQIGSSATLGTNSTFGGTMLASTSITVTTGTLVQGRALARNGSVTLDSNTVISGACTAPPVPTTTTSVTATSTATASVTSTVTQAGAASTAPFVPGAGLTGDTSPGNASPLKAILLGLTVAVLGSAAVIVRRRPRGKRA
jgi:hypothetical protein